MLTTCPLREGPCGYCEGDKNVTWCALLDGPVEKDAKCPVDLGHYDPPYNAPDELPF